MMVSDHGKQFSVEVKMAMPNYVERALFLIGDQNTGKSAQLRSLFRDPRLGNGGQVPDTRNIRNSYALSNERWLYLRLTSPHEKDETIEEFLDKCAHDMSPGHRTAMTAYRWNFAGALQVSATYKLCEGAKVIEAFGERFSPERMRGVILSPDWTGNTMEWNDLKNLTNALREIPDCEVMTVDATCRQANGLMYADYFDFT